MEENAAVEFILVGLKCPALVTVVAVLRGLARVYLDIAKAPYALRRPDQALLYGEIAFRRADGGRHIEAVLADVGRRRIDDDALIGDIIGILCDQLCRRVDPLVGEAVVFDQIAQPELEVGEIALVIVGLNIDLGAGTGDQSLQTGDRNHLGLAQSAA